MKNAKKKEGNSKLSLSIKMGMKIRNNLMELLSNLVYTSEAFPLIDMGNLVENEDGTPYLWWCNLRTKSITQVNIQWKDKKIRIFYNLLQVQSEIYIVGISQDYIGDSTYWKDIAFAKISVRQTKLTQLQDFIVLKGERGMCGYKNKYIFSFCGAYLKTSMNSCEKYDIVNDKWAMFYKTKECKYNVGSAVVENHIYLFGGYGSKGHIKTIEKIHPIEGRNWLPVEIKKGIIKEFSRAKGCQSDGNSILIFGEGVDYKRFKAKINLEKEELVEWGNISEDVFYTSFEFHNYFAVANSNNILKIKKDGTLDKHWELGKLLMEWKKDDVTIVADGWKLSK